MKTSRNRAHPVDYPEEAAPRSNWRKSLCALVLLAAGGLAPGAFAQYDLILDAGDAEGIANGPAIVGVELTALTGASTVQFQVQFDPAKLDYATVYPGESATQAGKVVSASVSQVAPGTVNVVISGSGTSGVQTIIPDGQVAQLGFEVAAGATVGDIIPVLGGVVTASTPGAVSIPSAMTDGQVTVVACRAPGQPTAVTATNGAFTDRVRVSWKPSLMADTYTVFRGAQNSLAAAVAIGTVNWDTSFDDVLGAFSSSSDTGGCGGAGNAPRSVPTYYYWVLASNRCGLSGFSSSDAGTVASSKSAFPRVVRPEVLPAGGIASPVDALAIRLDAGDAAGANGAAVTVDGSGAAACTFEVISASADDGDVWLVLTPVRGWVAGGLVHVRAAAQPDTAPSAEAVFRIGGEAVSPADGTRLRVVSSKDTDSLKTALLGQTFAVEPSAPFHEPEWIWLPVPPSLSADAAAPYYLHNSEWRRADTVQGWLAEPGFKTMDKNGRVYLGFKVRHGGTVRLGESAPKAVPAAAGLCPGGGAVGGSLLLMAAAGVLVLMRYLRTA